MALVITNSSLAGAKLGVAYSQTLTATGGVAPLTWSITSGTLPLGLSLNAATGVISGTPLSVVTAAITFHVVDSTPVTPLTANATLSINVSGSVQAVGSAAIKTGNEASVTFPLLPQVWPLTQISASDPVTAELLPQNANPPSAAQAADVLTALAQAGNQNNRLV